MRKEKWSLNVLIPLLFSIISVGFNIYQYFEGINNSKEFSEFEENSLKQNDKMLLIVEGFAYKLNKYDLNEID